MDHFIDWHDHTGTNQGKFFKTTLWQGDHVTVGLNCLEPGQIQSVHVHEDMDKHYFVLEGSGWFTIGAHEQEARPGTLVVAPAGASHGVRNTGSERLSLLVTMAPGIK